MAEDPKKSPGDPMQMLWMVLGAFAILVFLWFVSGAYKNADIRGLFIAPPPPVGPGGAYGPEVGQPNPNYQTNEQPAQ